MSIRTSADRPIVRKQRRRILGLRLGSTVAAATAAAIAVLGIASPAIAQVKPPGDYFEIDFTAAEPTSYNHLTGGGAYDAGVSNVDTVQSLEGKQFACGDIVSFMTKIKMNDAESGAYGATTVRMYYSFDMASSGSANGVGFSDLITAKINYPPIAPDLLQPASTIDDAIVDDGNSHVTNTTVVKVGSMWVKDSHLDATFDINDIEAGETIVLQVDMKLKCDPTQSTATGNVQAKLTNSEVIATALTPNGTTLPNHINSGVRTIPMKSPGDIHYPQVSLQKTVTTPTGDCATATDSLAVNSGDQVKYCYAITNPSNVLNPPGTPLYQLRIKDDAGTPGNTGDDWWIDTSTISGLQNLDGVGSIANDLAPGVTAHASVVRTVTYVDSSTKVINTATAYGDDSVIDPYTLSASDTAQVVLFVPAPAVDIDKTTSNTVDPLPSDNPIIYVGETVHWQYEVTNTGNVPLNTITVTDNRGVSVSCPSTTLAVGEKMTCTASGTAIAGTYSNIGTAVAHYNSETVTASDPSGYFGRDPRIDVQKLPATQTVVQGGTANFTIIVTNTGNMPLTSVSISDPLAPACTGSLPNLAVSDSTTVTCSATDVTAPFTNVVTASGTAEGRVVTDTASADVVVDYLPNIAVTKTANPTHVSELGGSVSFTVTVQNNANENFILNSLTDTIYGNLDNRGTCDVPQTISPAGSYSCAFTETVSGEPSTAHVDTVTASGVDPQGNPGSASDNATVTFDDVQPDISVTKTAAPTAVSELGGLVQFTVVVTNHSAEQVLLTSLSDSIFGNLVGKGNCATGGWITGGGGTYTCVFSETVTGEPTLQHVNTITAVAADNDGNTDTATATATVTFVDVQPDISVTKTVNPTHVPEPGGSVEFTILVTNHNGEQVQLTSLTDSVFGNLAGKGTCATGGWITGNGGTYTCSFSDTVTGQPAAPHTDTVTAIASDNDGNSDTATASAQVTFDDIKPDITVTKTANPTHISELGGSVEFTVVVHNVNAEAVTLDSLTDSVYGNLHGKGTCATGGSIAGGGDYSCAFSETVTGEPALPHFDTVTAVASDNDGNSDTATASATVTFDDVQPDISVTKTPDTTHVSELGGAVQFTVVVTNHSAEQVQLTTLSDSVFGNLVGKGTCATGGWIIGNGGTYTCAFTQTITGEPSTPHVDTVTAIAADNDGNSDTATASATVTFDDVAVDITVTKIANPTHISELGGSVLFTVVVHNVNAETVTLTSLDDSVFGNLNGQGTCTTGATIAGGGSYSCSFSRPLIGQPATPHTDTVTAVAADNDGNSDTATATATVTFDNVLPDITVVKTANPTTLPVSGGYVDYLIRITNAGQETVTITSFSDSKLTLPETCTSIVGQTLAPGAWIDCVLAHQWIVPDATGQFVNTATATGCDDDSSCDTDTGTATVKFSWYGRTPGYWKNHPAAWPTPYLPTQLLNTVFTLPSGITSPSGKPDAGDTLMTALGYQGGSGTTGAAQILLRAATAALLNEQYYGEWYPATSIGAITSAVNAALAGTREAMLTLATQLDKWNNGIEAALP